MEIYWITQLAIAQQFAWFIECSMVDDVFLKWIFSISNSKKKKLKWTKYINMHPNERESLGWFPLFIELNIIKKKSPLFLNYLCKAISLQIAQLLSEKNEQ